MRAGLMLALAVIGGCYKTRFDFAPPQPEVPSGVISDQYHIAVINLVEVSRPVDFQGACMGAAPTAVEERIGVLAGIVDIFITPLANPLHLHNATVYCPMYGAQPTGPQQPPTNQPPPPSEPQPPQPPS